MFNDIEINKGFYFSYTYDLTRSLQENILRKIRRQQEFMDGIQDFSEVYCDDFYTDKDGHPTNILQSFS